MVDKQTIEELEIIIKANVTQAMQGIEQVVNTVKQDANKIKAPIQQISTDVDRSITKSTKGIERALDTISGKSSKLGNIRTQIKDTIEYIGMLKKAISDIKSGEIAPDTKALIETFATKSIASERNIPIESVDYKEVEKQVNEVLSSEEKRAQLLQAIGATLKDNTKELEKQENEYKKVQNTDNWHKGLEKIWHSFKRGLLTIMGVRSAWALLRKGMSEALQTSEKLQAQVRVTSNAFGQLFLPVMEKVVAITRKAVIFIGLVIEALTGVNLLAKATTKSIQDQNKALEGTLSSIDEIENLTSQNQTYLNDIEALGQFQEEVAKMRQMLKDSGIYEWLEKVGRQIREVIIPKLKELWNEHLKPFIQNWLIPTLKHLWDEILYPMLTWILDHPNVFATLFAVFMTGKLLKNLIDVSTALGGISGALQGLYGLGAVVITVAIACKIGNDIIELGDDWEGVRKSAKKFWTTFYDEMEKASDDVKLENKETLENGLASLDINTDANNDTLLNLLYPSKQREQMRTTYQNYKKMIALIEEYHEKNLLTADDYKRYRGYVDDYYEALKRLSNEYTDTYGGKDEMIAMMKEVDEYYGTLYKYEQEANSAINSTTKGLENQASWMGRAYGEMKSKLLEANNQVKKTAEDIGSEKQGSLLYNFRKVADVLKQGLKINLQGDTVKLKRQLEEALKDVFKNFGSFGSSIYSKLISNAVFQADGYVAYGPTLAVQGEYAGARTNPEITAPQTMIEESMINAFTKIAPYLGANNQHGDIVLNINGREFARATYEDTQNEIARRNSSTAIKVVR